MLVSTIFRPTQSSRTRFFFQCPVEKDHCRTFYFDNFLDVLFFSSHPTFCPWCIVWACRGKPGASNSATAVIGASFSNVFTNIWSKRPIKSRQGACYSWVQTFQTRQEDNSWSAELTFLYCWNPARRCVRFRIKLGGLKRKGQNIWQSVRTLCCMLYSKVENLLTGARPTIHHR